MRCLLILLLAPFLCSGAASITVVSATVPSAGRIVSVPISGCTGTLSPASGVTGITVTGNLGGTANPLQIASVTSTGTCAVNAALTVTLASFAASSETVNIALATSASSNLTDTASNTPTGNSVNATNNSTITGTYEPTYPDATCTVGSGGSSHAVLTSSGFGAGSGYLGQNYCGYSSGAGSQIWIEYNGSEGDALMPPGFAGNWTVDGGSNQSYTASGSAWVRASIFSGLTNTAHLVVFSSAAWISTNHPAYFVGGASAGAASFSLPPGTSQNLYKINTNTTNIGHSGAALQTINGYANLEAWQGQFYLSFTSSGLTGIQAWKYCSSTAFAWNVLQDGVSIGTYNGCTGSAYALQGIASGISGSGSHFYQLIGVTASNATVFDQVDTIMLVGGALSAVTQTTLPTLEQFGDSITLFFGVIPNSQQADTYNIAAAESLGPWSLGVSGAKVAQLLTEVTTLDITPAYKVAIFAGGENDVGVTTIGNCTTPATFTYEYLAVLTAMGGYGVSGSVLLARGILPSTTVGTAAYNAAIQAAAACYNATSPTVPVYYFSTDGWISASPNGSCIMGFDTVDGVHPCQQGYQKIVAQEVPILQRYVYGCVSGVGLAPKCNGIQ